MLEHVIATLEHVIARTRDRLILWASNNNLSKQVYNPFTIQTLNKRDKNCSKLAEKSHAIL